MSTAIGLFVILFLILFAIQLFFDTAFIFLCYLVGVLALKAVAILNTKYNILSYRVFKEQYKTKPGYKKPITIGMIILSSSLFILIALQ